MILVDTAVWIDHLRGAEPRLAALLDDNQVLIHPMVAGELACGNLRDRHDVLRLLGGLPQAPVAADDEVLRFIERHHMMGCGIALHRQPIYWQLRRLATPSLLWTSDERLRGMAARLGLAYDLPR